jgi:hypothetical protein
MNSINNSKILDDKLDSSRGTIIDFNDCNKSNSGLREDLVIVSRDDERDRQKSSEPSFSY